jgi:predicted transcriptional regulator
LGDRIFSRWENQALETKYLLISVRSEYADKLLSSQKTIELRRKFPAHIPPNTPFLIYSSRGDQAVVAKGIVSKVVELGISELWQRAKDHASVTRAAFNEYFEGLEQGFAIFVENVVRTKSQTPAALLKTKFNIVPPQSFRYLSEVEYELLAGGDENPDRHEYNHRPGR